MSGFRTDPRHGVLDPDGCIVLAGAAAARAMDGHAIATEGVPSRLLMELAGARAAALIMERLGGHAGRARILCGPGNNGGDGYVVARHLLAAGWQVEVLAAAPPATPDAQANAGLLMRARGAVLEVVASPSLDDAALAARRLTEVDLLVDALLGTGLSRPPEGEIARLLAAFGAERPVPERALRVALDLPSGLGADRGEAFDGVFQADLTVSFGVLKAGLVLGAGPEVAGEVEAVPIGWPMASVAAFAGPGAGHPALRRPRSPWFAARVPARLPDGHKGRYGHVAIVGGLGGTGGAALLAARGALRAGAGLCTWAGGVTSSELPEIMTYSPVDPDEPAAEPDDRPESPALPPRATVLVIGPGLGAPGDSGLGDRLRAACAADPRPRVLDADALTPASVAALAPVGVPAVLTPHPLEAARLLETDLSVVLADRVAAATAIAARYRAVTVLKGRNPVIASPDASEPALILDLTAPALSAGGTGDVLAGVIGALIAQGCSLRDAAALGAELHGRAGLAAGLETADRGVLASEVADAVPRVLAALLSGWGG